jgi:AcrR family transcriptional regulator
MLSLLISALNGARLDGMTRTREGGPAPAADSTPAGPGTTPAEPGGAPAEPARSRAAAPTARERARAQITLEIKEEARRQLAAQGAQRLSLRAVARELGMVSSALYRYFPSRDDLLTALIIDAYDGLGASAEAAGAGLPRTAVRGRWRAACRAIRGWAIAHPHEYALIYGSPVPGYRAPQETTAAAVRAPAVIGRVLRDAWQETARREAPAGTARTAAREAGQRLPGLLAGQAEGLASAIAPGVPPTVMARALIAWTQLFGMISFELFGQFVGSADPSDDLFDYAVDQMADFVGLPS